MAFKEALKRLSCSAFRSERSVTLCKYIIVGSGQTYVVYLAHQFLMLFPFVHYFVQSGYENGKTMTSCPRNILSILTRLQDHYAVAINRAVKRQMNQDTDSVVDRNPYTEMHELVELLIRK